MRKTMMKKAATSMTAVVLCLGLLSAVPASAQPSKGAPAQTNVSRHHQMAGEMMKDMSQEMNKMTEEMSRGEPSPDQKKQMSRRMEGMSKMMHRMSGLLSRPAMKEADMQKQMEQMRRRMDDIKRDPAMKAPAK